MSSAPLVTGNTAHTQPENRVFYPALDGLRCLALLMVFGQHYMSLPWGWTGVNVFFVLSGFLITGILFDSRHDPHRLRNFYVRRTLRIFPLYYAVFLVLLLAAPWMHWDWTPSWLAWPLYLGNFLRFRSPLVMVPFSAQQVAGNAWLISRSHPAVFLYLGHFWSLCVEEQFYLVWPAVVFWVGSRRALLWICAATVTLVPLARLLTQSLAPGWMLQSELLYRFTPFQLDALLLGGLIALLWRGSHRAQLLLISRWLARLCFVVAALYLAVTIHRSGSDWRLGYVYPVWRLTWGMYFVDIFSAAVILCCLQPGRLIHRVLSLRPLRWVGRISYGAYIFHDIPHQLYGYLVARIGQHSHLIAAHVGPLSTLLGLLSTLLLAWLSFRFFESPFLELKERWTIRPARSRL